MWNVKVLFLLSTLLCLESWDGGQLVVNYKNKGDEIIKEVIESNPEQDTILISFQLYDGTLVKQLIDYKNEVQIFKLRYLPERVLNESGIKECCFINAFKRHNMISPDAMSKLRQKNPNAIRRVEEVMSSELYRMNMKLSKNHLNFISPYPSHYCSSAQHIYAIESELESMLADSSPLGQRRSLRAFPLKSCASLSRGAWCVCQVRVCIGWYPCGLKYCKGKDFDNKLVTYRCGIKACEKCHDFEFVERFKICPTSGTKAFSVDVG